MNGNRTKIGRRGALRAFAAGAIACPVCAATATLALAGENAPWSYEGHEGPDNWADLSPEFKTCELGVQQSPIDLTGPVPASLGAIEPSFGKMPLSVVNNGHTIQVDCAPGSGTLIAGHRYELLQFHFHHPSEHLLSGTAFDMELHFVHRSARGALAVLGVFIQPGQANAALAPIWDAMPKNKGGPAASDATIDPGALLPRDRAYFRYHGSLTTPPCSEGVLWTVYQQPIEASMDQIRRFAELFPANARPAQELNRRFLLRS